jgi:serine/threonine-protein kinase
MATVYLAEDIRHGRPVAVKVLRPDLAEAIGSDRFLHEIEIAAGLNHPHILTLIDSGEAGGFLYFVMPYVDGGSLRGFLRRRGPVSLGDALPLVREIADALGHAHRRGIIHRDVKPENVLLSEGHAVVTDFGIAKAVITAGGEQLTRSGFPLGTPGYMSPQQAAGRTDLDATTDVYGLACVVYEMLIGETPGMWLDAEAVRLGRFSDASPVHRARLDGLPGRIERVLAKALAMRIELRYASPAEFVAALEASRGGGPRLSDEEARRLLERAAELDAGSATVDGDYALSIGGVQRIGAEAGIPPDHIAAAAREVLPGDSLPARGGVLGLRPRLAYERRTGVTASTAAYPRVLAEIRATLGEMGQLEATLDDGFAWSSRPEGTGRKAHVIVHPGDGDTLIRVTDDEGGSTAVVLVPIGAVSAVLLGVVGAIVHQVTGSDLVAAVMGGTVSLTTFGTGYWVLRRTFQRQLRQRHAQLRGLLDRLESIVREGGLARPDAANVGGNAHADARPQT